MQAFPSAITQRHSVIIRVAVMLLPVFVLLAMVIPATAAQNTFVITDGKNVTVHTTDSEDPAQALDQAGIVLQDCDTYTTAVADDGVSEITVQRGQTITVFYCDQPMETVSYGETVQALLQRLSLPFEGDYRVSADLNTETYDGMEVRVDRILCQTLTYTEDIPYETTYCYDPDLCVDEMIVMVEGCNGQKQITAEVTYTNTAQTDRTLVSETVIQEPVDAVIVVGTAEEPGDNSLSPAIGDGVIVTTDGQILTYSKTGQFKATAYTHTDEGCNMTTATGTTVHVGTVAVDPTVIPYGTRMFIVTNDGSYIYGIGTAEDCGGAIKGNRLDLYFPTDPECWAFGVRAATVYFLD